MARKKKDGEILSELNEFSSLAASFGGKVLSDIRFAYFIDTGNLALNFICSGKFMGGGIPTGITEIYGPPASSKSLLGYTAIGQTQKKGGVGILLDFERAANSTFAVTAGHVDAERLIVVNPKHIEDAETMVFALTKKIREMKGEKYPILFVFDSISVAMCQREYEETIVDAKGNRTMTKEQPGERAKRAGAFFRKVNPFLDDNNASMIVINQTRDSIGAYMNPEVTGGGGRALPYYANCRLRTSAASKAIVDTNLDIAVGVALTFRNKKSRACRPFMTTSNVQLYFDKGINPVGGLLSTLIASGRVIKASAGNYKTEPSFTGEESVSFKASKERNDVPMDLLLKYPALVDAESAEELKEYFGTFSEAIELTNSDAIAAMDVEDEIAAKLGLVGEDDDD